MKFFSAPKPKSPAPKSMTVRLADIRRVIRGDDFRIKAINVDGHATTVDFRKLSAPGRSP